MIIEVPHCQSPLYFQPIRKNVTVDSTFPLPRPGCSHTGREELSWWNVELKTPGVILTRVRVPGAARNFLSESTASADSLAVSVQPPRAIACINICAQVIKSQALTAIPLFEHTEILHTLIGMGSAALAAAVPDPGTLVRRHKFPLKKELIVHSTSQHSTTLWSEHRAFRKAKLPRGGQIVHSSSQHSTS